MNDLSDAGRAALQAIIGGEEAWIGEELLIGSGHIPDIMGALADLGWTERWAWSGGAAWTLTPWGAWAMGVEVQERIEVRGVELRETPRWVEVGKVPPPIRLPRNAVEGRLPWPEEVADERTEPEALIDEASGEPVRLFGQVVYRAKPKKVAPKKRRRRAG